MTLKRTLFALIALLGALALYTAQLISTPKPPAHQVFLGGDVLTMDSDNTVAEAISVRAGVIDAVGTDADIAALITPATQVVRLEGRTLIPGFIDAHGLWQTYRATAVLRPSLRYCLKTCLRANARTTCAATTRP